ncbi:response regulator [Bariatricus massiliensis]|uniref:Stage 0 sporulation protein A homolog n=1 Tax=Bariatricus massiliensis TaxID=1745713 RepID=A0ABS8DJ09_9FIRM|nr:PAS domain-containing hybrid sensor histidine kinase/response regulator [Bariatricus massiliensis]MCB7304670.1 response regulator [Bariatricus massiliensis]MCB7374821.1 response regulator [Bariatricus massiliensis]MCB7388052.1 response regulator [Bariatricus massiliensis]MCB7411986.1 response regulator [Bariatricus massiliensis]MCQ5254223.1 response regulator [Bariatricus massiliensis]
MEHDNLEKKAGYFKWMLDEYAGNAYVSDITTYELLYLNKTSCETLCLPPKEALGKKCYEIIQGRTSPCPYCTNKLLTETEFYEWEFYNKTLDRTFMIKNRLIDWDGRMARLELSHDNYSPEYNLAKKERERDAIIRTIPGGFARVDARDMRTILWYGGGFLNLIGYTPKQFEEELHSQCTYVHPEDLDRAVEIMQNAKVSGSDTSFETRIITRSGNTKILTMTFSYVSSEDSWDGIPSFYSVGIDVTKEREEQERQRKALEEAYQAARVASSAKTNFLSSMSHDIRTPMNAIMGMAAIAQANLNYPEKIHDCLNKIGTSSRHLLSLINEVLDMSKIESGKLELTLEQINLPTLIQSITDMCRPLLSEKQHDFQISIGQVRHENVIADEDRLRQILMNLLSNAIKYTPEKGTIILRINELPSQTPKKSQYEFICIDNGIGISSEFLPSVFEPFSRAEDPRISKLQGTGLGMTITENIVHMMNGTIEVESELGSGSKFTVSVPLEYCAEEELNSDELTGLPVLVVDDDQITCENATALLNELGMRGYWVLSGAEAVSRISDAHVQHDDFFAVILDWKMPEMDGLQTVRAIRGRLGDDVPIIIISAYDYSEIEEEFLQAGADAFITKPLFKSRMLQVLLLFVTENRSDATESISIETCSSAIEKRVLLAEDNDINRDIAVELLEMQNIRVDAVENGQKAVETFKASSPGEYSAILMDIQMPVLNGYDATSAIRSLNRADARTIPIFALTADAFTADVVKARSVGMNEHIAKPIDIKHLMTVLQKWTE